MDVSSYLHRCRACFTRNFFPRIFRSVPFVNQPAVPLQTARVHVPQPARPLRGGQEDMPQVNTPRKPGPSQFKSRPHVHLHTILAPQERARCVHLKMRDPRRGTAAACAGNGTVSPSLAPECRQAARRPPALTRAGPRQHLPAPPGAVAARLGHPHR